MVLIMKYSLQENLITFRSFLTLAGITVLWALAASLVPAMQKGSETAKNLHIALNAVNVLLFISQIPTGIEIVYKVFEFTKWPWIDNKIILKIIQGSLACFYSTIKIRTMVYCNIRIFVILLRMCSGYMLPRKLVTTIVKVSNSVMLM